LSHLGLARNDVKILQLGGPATRIAAALSGQIAGTMEQYPDTAEISAHGFHVLVDLTDLAGDYPNTSYLTSRAFLKKNPDAVKRFLMAIATAIHEFKNNPAEAVKLTQAFLSIKDTAIATAAYEAYLKVYPDIPRPSLVGIALVLKQIAATEPKAKGFTAEQLVESGPIDALEREGFFKKLFASGS
jgi:ABC-type nitrate/sulfonate/bicarbonate transport system substrate-binding protein